MADDIQVAVDAAGVAVVTLNRPEKRNVVSLAMWRGLGEIYRDFARRSDVRVVILTGAGGHFCGGADISEFSKVRNSVEDARMLRPGGHGRRRRRSSTCRSRRSPRCMAMAWAAAVGWRWPAISAWAMRRRRWAFRPRASPSSTARWTAAFCCARSGLANAKLVLYSGRYFPLADCRAMGLIDVVSEQGALAGAQALAQELCTRAPLSQRGAKVVLEALDRGEAEQRAAEIAAMQEAAVNSEDYRAARQAFLEKRTPVFKGR